MNAILKLAGLITKGFFTTKPLTKRLCDGAEFVIRQELKGKQTRRSFFTSFGNFLDKVA